MLTVIKLNFEKTQSFNKSEDSTLENHFSTFKTTMFDIQYKLVVNRKVEPWSRKSQTQTIFFRLTNPLNDTQFDVALDKLQNDFEEANSKNQKDNLHNSFTASGGFYRNTYKKYKDNEKKILDEYKKAKHRLYEDRADAKIVANRFTNGTDSLTVQSLANVLERYENELLENNRRMNDNMGEYLKIMPHVQYHVGVTSTLGTVFGMLISFLAFIIIKKFRPRTDPVQQTLF